MHSLLVLVSLLAQPGVAAAQDVHATAERKGKYVEVTATVELPVEVRVAWGTLTDYARLAEFIPDMASSRVISRDAGLVEIEQKGNFGFFIFRQAIEVRYAVAEEPMRRIEARAISGSFPEFTGVYELTRIADGGDKSGPGVRIDYRARFIAGFAIPPVLGLFAIRQSIESTYRSMAREIMRRGGAAVPVPARPAELPQ